MRPHSSIREEAQCFRYHKEHRESREGTQKRIVQEKQIRIGQ